MLKCSFILLSDGSYVQFFVLLLRFQSCNYGTRKKNLVESLLSSYEDGLWYEYDL